MAGTANTSSGTVYLVGAGPGDPGLLTVRGKYLLEIADVVVYDYLADESLLAHCRPDVRLIDVGKRPGRPVPQSEINEVLIESALGAQTVVRLKGGDPFVFGRGGEEALALSGAGIEFEIVPGVTSAVAVPAYAGIPATHRGLSTSFTVVTGHRHGNATDQVDWESLARLGGTIVILMGVAHRAEISKKLIEGGLDPAVPVAAVRWGTRGDQMSLRTTLADLAEADIASPSTIVVGAVASLNLSWFERRPLLGKKIALTRARSQVSELRSKLEQLGATTLSVATIEISAPSDGGSSLAEATQNLSAYSWVVFSSANSVEPFFSRLHDARELGGIKVAAIGGGTAREVKRFNVECDLVPANSVAEALVSEFPAGQGRILLPQSELARDVIPVGLGAKGWQVDVVAAYTTRVPEIDPRSEQELISCDAIAFTSSSTVNNFIELFGVGHLPEVVAAIGPVTNSTLVEHGYERAHVAKTHDVQGLVDIIRSALSGG